MNRDELGPAAVVLLLLLTAGWIQVKPDPSTLEPEIVATVPALDLKTLEQQLKDTKAIGFFTKLTLKNQVDDLLDQFRDYYRGKVKLTMTDLRRSYDLLMMKVLSLLLPPPRTSRVAGSLHHGAATFVSQL